MPFLNIKAPVNKKDEDGNDIDDGLDNNETDMVEHKQSILAKVAGLNMLTVGTMVMSKNNGVVTNKKARRNFNTTNKSNKSWNIKTTEESTGKLKAKQFIKYNSFSKQNNEVKNNVLKDMVGKCQQIVKRNDDFYKINNDVGTQLNQLIDCLNRDRPFKTTMAGIVFRELISSGKGIY